MIRYVIVLLFVAVVAYADVGSYPPANAVIPTPQPTPTLVPTATPQPTPTLVATATPQPTATPFGGDRSVFSGSTGIGALGATMLASMYKPTVAITLTRISGIILAAGTCTACGVTDHTFRVTDGNTNSDCTNASAVSCTTAAGTVFFCTPSNANRAADQQISLEVVSSGGTCTVAPIMGINAEFKIQ